MANKVVFASSFLLRPEMIISLNLSTAGNKSRYEQEELLVKTQAKYMLAKLMLEKGLPYSAKVFLKAIYNDMK